MGFIELLIITMIILTVLVFSIMMSKIGIKLMEPFYDITPYEAHWDIFKCLTPQCVRSKGYECYKWCDKIDEPGARENCRMRCADYSDEQFDYWKFQKYNWDIINPEFSRYSILEDTNDFVMTRGIPKSDSL